MTGFHQVLIGGYPGGGLTQDRKPALLANEAYSYLENAYVWRERTKKRDGEVPIGQLQRSVTVSVALNLNSGQSVNLITALGLEATASIVPKSINVTGNIDGTTYTDPSGNGILTATGGTGTGGTINYATGLLYIIAGAGETITGTIKYSPGLPVMGILKRDVATIGIDSTVFFDTKYAYQFSNGFQELSPGTTWSGTNTDFFWAANYQGATPDLRYFFVTNNNITLGAATPYDPIRYYSPSSWTNLQPLVTATITLWQTLILIPYYGRLLALNTWEGTTAGGVAGAVNFFARCRFSQIGNPVD